MNNLIPINYESDKPTVSARELHQFLEVKTDFRHWFDRMTEYGFTEETDFRTFLTESNGGRPAQDAQLTIDMAKELCMIQRTERGKQARQYFIQIERDWNSPEKIMARALEIAHNNLHSLEAKIERDKSKVLFADSVAASGSTVLIGELAKILKQNGVEIGERRLFEWLRKRGYLIRRSGSDYNAPTQKAMELSLFKVKETSITHADGHVTVNRTTKVTGKGQQYFIDKFLSDRKETA
ncbi:phage antirepressor KilAC domain-containing protein [Caproiciproducens sp.]